MDNSHKEEEGMDNSHQLKEEVMVVGMEDSNSSNHMVDKEVMGNKWVLHIKEELINKVVMVNNNKAMVVADTDKDKEIHTNNNSLIHMVHLVDQMVNSCHSQVRENSHSMEMLHHLKLMALLGRKTFLQKLKKEKYLQVELVVQQNKTFIITSRNLEQLKITV